MDDTNARMHSFYQEHTDIDAAHSPKLANALAEYINSWSQEGEAAARSAAAARRMHAASVGYSYDNDLLLNGLARASLDFGLSRVAYQHTRQPHRSARACQRCRQGKQKCSGELPCTKCVQRGHECVYENKIKKPSAPPSTSAPAPVPAPTDAAQSTTAQAAGATTSMTPPLTTGQQAPIGRKRKLTISTGGISAFAAHPRLKTAKAAHHGADLLLSGAEVPFTADNMDLQGLGRDLGLEQQVLSPLGLVQPDASTTLLCDATGGRRSDSLAAYSSAVSQSLLKMGGPMLQGSITLPPGQHLAHRTGDDALNKDQSATQDRSLSLSAMIAPTSALLGQQLATVAPNEAASTLGGLATSGPLSAFPATSYPQGLTALETSSGLAHRHLHHGSPALGLLQLPCQQLGAGQLSTATSSVYADCGDGSAFASPFMTNVMPTPTTSEPAFSLLPNLYSGASSSPAAPALLHSAHAAGDFAYEPVLHAAVSNARVSHLTRSSQCHSEPQTPLELSGLVGMATPHDLLSGGAVGATTAMATTASTSSTYGGAPLQHRALAALSQHHQPRHASRLSISTLPTTYMASLPASPTGVEVDLHGFMSSAVPPAPAPSPNLALEPSLAAAVAAAAAAAAAAMDQYQLSDGGGKMAPPSISPTGGSSLRLPPPALGDHPQGRLSLDMTSLNASLAADATQADGQATWSTGHSGARHASVSLSASSGATLSTTHSPSSESLSALTSTSASTSTSAPAHAVPGDYLFLSSC